MADREVSMRATSMRPCAPPAPKTLDSYDWFSDFMTEALGRDGLTSLGLPNTARTSY